MESGTERQFSVFIGLRVELHQHGARIIEADILIAVQHALHFASELRLGSLLLRHQQLQKFGALAELVLTEEMKERVLAS